MTYIPYWFSSGATGGGGGDAQIGQSLRFRGNQFMSRTAVTPSDATEFTLSFWVKRGELSVNQCIMYSGLDKDNKNDYISFPANDTIEVKQRRNVIDYTTQTTAAFRDPSAWYHIVYTWEDGDRTIYVNGIEQTCDPDQSTTATHYWQTAGRIIDIGRDTNNGGSPTAYFEGYLSDYYFIDGQALLPTAFGRYNDDGVWVPREVDFTPAEMRWSDFLFADQTGNNTNAPNFDATTPAQAAEFAFNGSTTSGASAAGAASTIIFRPAEPIEGVTGLRVFTDNQARIWVNETLSNITQGATAGWADLGGAGSAITFPLDLTNLALNGNAGVGASGSLNAIEVTDANGTRILTNPFLWSAECFTAPNGTTTFDYTTTAKNFISAPSFGFDGDTTAFTFAAVDNSLLFRPATAITGVNQLEMFTDGNLGYVFAVNSQEVALDASTPLGTTGYKQVVLPAGFNGTLNNFGIRRTTVGGASGFGAIRINGNQILIDGANPSYGANGFHLTFADPDDLGLDTSGNQNNFTANGFNTDINGVRTELFEEPFRNFQAAVDTTTNPIGFIPTAVPETATNEQLLFELETPLTSVDIVWNNGVASAGGVSLFVSPDGTANSFVQILNNASITGTITVTNADAFRFIRIGATSGFNWGTGIQQPSGSPGPDYDSMQDSPTQNYATLNPLIGPGQAPGPQVIETERANLQAGPDQTGSDGFVNSTVFQTNQDVYVECTVEDVQNQIEVGFTPPGVRFGGGGAPFVNFFGFNQSSQVWIRDEDETRTDIALDATGQTFGFHVDVSEGDIDVYHNGAIIGTSTGWTFTEPRTFAVGSNGGSGVLTMTWNYGQQPFVQRPAALGDNTELQTQNLPTPTILDGSDNFRALTGTGANILAIAQGTNNTGDNWNPDVNTGFTNALWWIKDMDNTNEHQLVDSVRGGNLALRCPARTEGPYDPPDGNSIAWCWNLLGDRSNGFDIVTYTGDGSTANREIAHNLGAVPDMMIVKNRNDSLSYQVYHSAIPNPEDNVLWLDVPNSVTPEVVWGNTMPTATDFTVLFSGGPRTNGPVNNNFVAYLWNAVPGYSAFGSYTGNRDPNGPFVYTGFRPAFVMFKRVTGGDGNWVIYDSTRNPYNGNMDGLFPSTDDSEVGGYVVDLLSNGFKIRDTEVVNNYEETYVYATFAQNPFGGNNVSPANAR